MKIEDCDISVRLSNILEHMNINTLKEASEITLETWGEVRIAGKTKWTELQEILQQQGFPSKLPPVKIGESKSKYHCYYQIFVDHKWNS